MSKRIALIVLALSMTGCVSGPQETPDIEQNTQEDQASPSVESREEKEAQESDEISALYCDIYEKAIKHAPSDELKVMQAVISGLGTYGYAAVDEKNQVDMTGVEEVLGFCQAVDAGEEADLTMIVAAYSGGFTSYRLQTRDGQVEIVQSYYEYEDGHLHPMEPERYLAKEWKFTDEGYLFFGGDYDSELDSVLELGNVQECVGLRVQPIEERLREWNRRYLLPAGYHKNNLFLTDWGEENYGDLNFYDIFDMFYPILCHQPVPYKADENLGVGTVYRIPAKEFEPVIQSYIQIDRESLKARTTYFPEDDTYEYKPRGFYESEYPDIPYPEVVNDTENEDGTITLLVNAVYPQEHTSKAFSHQVVIRPHADGSFQYVSNQMLSSPEDHEMWWHSDRLMEEEWMEIYGNSHS